MRRVKPASSLAGIPVKRQPLMAEATTAKAGDLSERFMITENHPVAQRARIKSGFVNRVPRTVSPPRQRWEPSWIDRSLAKMRQFAARCRLTTSKPAKPEPPASDAQAKNSTQHITEIFS